MQASLPHQEAWRFRAECLADALGPLSIFDWREAGIFMLSFTVEAQGMGGSLVADVVGAIVFGAENTAKLRAGLQTLVDTIARAPDTHVLRESLKPEDAYDGERNGPFARGRRDP